MVFLSLLITATLFIAATAAFFSVWGLAELFSGIFTLVAIMGTSLEVAKLMAVSYLYRYWTKTGYVLKTYLITGVASLMLLTSMGVFGLLSSGYQQDILPLKQKTEQVELLSSERTRNLERKQQIDQIMTQGPTMNSVTNSSGNIDSRATALLREQRAQREQLQRQYKTELTTVTTRIAELDTQLLTLRKEILETEAHIGPVTYIAKAFNVDTDQATKWLILVIIFAFDPMAVALTLAVNVALRVRREENTTPQEVHSESVVRDDESDVVDDDGEQRGLLEQRSDEDDGEDVVECDQRGLCSLDTEEDDDAPDDLPAFERGMIEQDDIPQQKLYKSTGKQLSELIEEYKHLSSTSRTRPDLLSAGDMARLMELTGIMHDEGVDVYMS